MLIKSGARPGDAVTRGGGRVRGLPAAMAPAFTPTPSPPRPAYPGYMAEPVVRAPLPPAAGPPTGGGGIRVVDVPLAQGGFSAVSGPGGGGTVSPGSAPPRRDGDSGRAIGAVAIAAVAASLYAGAAPTGLTQAQVDRMLPTADTCFGNLALPHYSTAAVLNERLTLAIASTELDADDV